MSQLEKRRNDTILKETMKGESKVQSKALLAARHINLVLQTARKHEKNWWFRETLIKSRNNYIMKNLLGDLKLKN
jgi:hypothetical protein